MPDDLWHAALLKEITYCRQLVTRLACLLPSSCKQPHHACSPCHMEQMVKCRMSDCVAHWCALMYSNQNRMDRAGFAPRETSADVSSCCARSQCRNLPATLVTCFSPAWGLEASRTRADLHKILFMWFQSHWLFLPCR